MQTCACKRKLEPNTASKSKNGRPSILTSSSANRSNDSAMLKEVPMFPAHKPAKRAAKCLTIDGPLVPDDKIGDWLCVVGFAAIAVAVTMVPFVLL
jgi:hypothetical protein